MRGNMVNSYVLSLNSMSLKFCAVVQLEIFALLYYRIPSLRWNDSKKWLEKQLQTTMK